MATTSASPGSWRRDASGTAPDWDPPGWLRSRLDALSATLFYALSSAGLEFCSTVVQIRGI